MIFSPLTCPSASSVLPCLPLQVQPSASATRSTTWKPTLWRVFSYSLPGFPRPTITFTADRPAFAGFLHSRRTASLGLGGGTPTHPSARACLPFSYYTTRKRG